MKTLYSLFFLALMCVPCRAQRIIPLMNEGDHIGSLMNYQYARVNAMVQHDDDLFIAGWFDSLMGTSASRIARWDGAQVSALSGMPLPPDSPGIADLASWDESLIIATGLYGDSALLQYANESFDLLPYAFDLRCTDVCIFNDNLYASFSGFTEERGIYRLEQTEWVLIHALESAIVRDLTVFNDTLWFIDHSSIYQYDGVDIHSFEFNGEYDADYLNVVGDQLIVCGTFTDNNGGEFNAGVLTSSGITPWEYPFSSSFRAGKIFYSPDLNMYAVGRNTRPLSGDSTILFGNFMEPLKLQHDINGLSNFGGLSVFSIGTNGMSSESASFFNTPGLYTIHDGPRFASIHHHAIHADIFASGTFAMEHDEYFIGYSTYANNISTLYAGCPWVYGISSTDTLTCGTIYFGSNGFADGPYCTLSDKAFLEKYDRVWSVTRDEINTHINSFMLPDHIPAEGILNWPAHGNPDNGEATHIAPFVDVNSNGLYEPVLGDYPDVPGEQNILVLLHDSPLCTEGLDESLGIELQLIYYTLDGDDPMDETLFIHANIIQRAEPVVDSLAFGFWADFDIGNPTDDFIGCDPALDYFYAYNGSITDPPSSSSAGYGSHPPAQGMVFLSHELSAHLSMNVSANAINGHPYEPKDYYHYMRGEWKNGQQMTHGGNGLFNPLNDPPVPTALYMPHYPWENEPDSWNEFTAGHAPNDRRTVGSTSPWSVNEYPSMCLNLALVSARDTVTLENPHLASLALLRDKVEVLRSITTNSFGCGIEQVQTTTQNGTEDDNWFRVYPNPSPDVLTVSVPLNDETHEIEIHNNLGEVVYRAQLTGGPYLTIRADHFAPSVYFVTLYKEDKRLTRRWVKI